MFNAFYLTILIGRYFTIDFLLEMCYVNAQNWKKMMEDD